MVTEYDIPVSVEKSRDILREKFRSNAHIKDTRVIDMLVIKVVTIINTPTVLPRTLDPPSMLIALTHNSDTNCNSLF